MKRILNMNEEAWRLLKAYAALTDKNIGEAAELIIIERLSLLKEILKNV